MRSSRLRHWALRLCVLVLLTVAPMAWGQQAQPPQFPIGALTAETLTEDHKRDVALFVDYWSKALLVGSSPTAVGEAREKLFYPIRNPATPDCRNIYFGKLAPKIAPSIDSKDLSVKLNGLIVAAELNDGAVAEMCIKGLSDASPAVRYWAGRATADIASRSTVEVPIFSVDQQKRLLASLQKTMATERAEMVGQQMSRALGSLTIPEGQQALLQILTDRVALYRHELNRGLRADQEGLANIYNRLMIDEAHEVDIKPRLRSLAVVAARYLQVVAQGLQNKDEPVADDVKPIACAMVATVEDILKRALTKFDADFTPPPPPLASVCNEGHYPELMLNTLDWVGTMEKAGVLTNSKLKIDIKDLLLPPAGPAPARKVAAPADEPAVTVPSEGPAAETPAEPVLPTKPKHPKK